MYLSHPSNDCPANKQFRVESMGATITLFDSFCPYTRVYSGSY